jgi:hypothetical protein
MMRHMPIENFDRASTAGDGEQRREQFVITFAQRWRLFKRFEEICDRLSLTNKANRRAQTEARSTREINSVRARLSIPRSCSAKLDKAIA